MKSSELLEKTDHVMRFKHMARKTRSSYLSWLKQYFHWCAKKPDLSSNEKCESFLTNLAVNRKVAVSTQHQALCAIVFFYKHVINQPLTNIEKFTRTARGSRLPVVLSQQEVQMLLTELNGIHWLIGSLMYGAGLRKCECLSLRIKDIDTHRLQVTVRAGKGNKDRTTTLPNCLVDQLKVQISAVQRLHQKDIKNGYGEVYLPTAIERKYPNAKYETAWQFLFPSTKIGLCPDTNVERRHHIHESAYLRL